ncbi:MAG TPA: DUF1194 domain-containing protein, partial [Anaerolineales bacterium]|nr:DUF1194 domain-containing protein [Anaerolineales bacterium]
IAVAVTLATFCAGPARAQQPVDLELVLAVDVSLSMDFDEQRVQRDGYVAALRAEALPGPLFNSYDFGGYLIWALPEQPTFIDGRTDLYPTVLFQDYVTIENGGPTALEMLGRYGVRTALVRSSSPAATALAGSDSWRKVFSDDVAAVFTLR